MMTPLLTLGMFFHCVKNNGEVYAELLIIISYKSLTPQARDINRLPLLVQGEP